jgi:LysR family transcriptional regulator, glycine cleavage system transcriptional activator
MKVLSASKLKAFHLAGMTGSFKHAAHLLSVSPSAVSARVRSLESDLGVRLFKRGIRKLSLTEAGADYIREVEAAFANLEIATRELRSRFGEPVGGLRGPSKVRDVPRFLASAEHGMVVGLDWA